MDEHLKTSKATFTNMFTTVTGTSRSEYRKQFELVESTWIETSLSLDSKIEYMDAKEPEQCTKLIVRPIKVRAIK